VKKGTRIINPTGAKNSINEKKRREKTKGKNASLSRI
jgi:hypothetical protein